VFPDKLFGEFLFSMMSTLSACTYDRVFWGWDIITNDEYCFFQS